MIFKTFILAMVGVLYLTYQVARKRFGENKAKLFIFIEITVTVIQGIAMYIGLTYGLTALLLAVLIKEF